MQEYIKAINAFLSIFNLLLVDNISILTDNLKKYKIATIMDVTGSIVGTLSKDGDLGYKISIDSPVIGKVEAVTRKKTIEDKANINVYNIIYGVSEPKDKILYEVLTGVMEITAITVDNETSFGFRNNLMGLKDNSCNQVLSFESNYPTFDYSIECDGAELYFSGQPNSLVQMILSYKDRLNRIYIQVEKVTRDNMGHSISPIITLNHSIDTGNTDTGIIQTNIKCPVEKVKGSLVSFIYEFATTYDNSFYELIERIREYTRFGRVCLVDNILSLSASSSCYTAEELESMYGFIPQKLKNTPKMLPNGVVELPKFNGIARKKPKNKDKVEGTK